MSYLSSLVGIHEKIGLKNGKFYKVYNTALRGIMEKQKEAKRIQLKSSSDQMEEEMVDNIKSRQIILDKFFILIQGIYAGKPGVLAMFLIYIGRNVNFTGGVGLSGRF